MTLRDMLIDKEVSADGRDNAIALIAKNIPREDVRRGNNARTLKFVQVGGERHHTVGCAAELLMEAPEFLSANKEIQLRCRRRRMLNK